MSAELIDKWFKAKEKQNKPQNINCTCGKKVAEKKGNKLFIKCKCKHVVEV